MPWKCANNCSGNKILDTKRNIHFSGLNSPQTISKGHRNTSNDLNLKKLVCPFSMPESAKKPKYLSYIGCNRKPATLYQIIIRSISRNVNDFDQRWDLSQLPSKIKTDIVQWNQKMGKPIVGGAFVHLLSRDLFQLTAQMQIDDQILDSIANNCKHLIEFKCLHQKNTFTEAGFIHFVHRMKHIQIFYVEHSNIMNDKIVEVMRIKWPELRSLHLIHCPNITTKCSQSLREMPLIELSLTKTAIDDEFLNDLKYSALTKNLKDICLRDCKVTSEGLKDLDWNVLENINIFGIPLTDLSFIPPTAIYKTLKWSV